MFIPIPSATRKLFVIYYPQLIIWLWSICFHLFSGFFLIQYGVRRIGANAAPPACMLAHVLDSAAPIGYCAADGWGFSCFFIMPISRRCRQTSSGWYLIARLRPGKQRESWRFFSSPLLLAPVRCTFFNPGNPYLIYLFLQIGHILKLPVFGLSPFGYLAPPFFGFFFFVWLYVSFYFTAFWHIECPIGTSKNKFGYIFPP